MYSTFAIVQGPEIKFVYFDQVLVVFVKIPGILSLLTALYKTLMRVNGVLGAIANEYKSFSLV